MFSFLRFFRMFSKSAAALRPVGPPDAASTAIAKVDVVALEQRYAERQKIIDAARNMPLLDGVFSLELYDAHSRRMGPPPYAPPVEFAEAFPYIKESELADARSRSAKLIACAYAVGDSHIESKFTNGPEVITQLAAENPGFGDASYSATLSYGCFQAR